MLDPRILWYKTQTGYGVEDGGKAFVLINRVVRVEQDHDYPDCIQIILDTGGSIRIRSTLENMATQIDPRP